VVIAALLMLILGAAFAILGLAGLKRRFMNVAWIASEGIVISAGVETSLDPHGDPKRSLRPYLEYSYGIKNRKYRSDRIFPAVHRYFGEKDARDFLAKYKVGEPIKVWVNKLRPSDSLLSLHSFWGDVAFFLFGFLILSFAIWQLTK
jgi:Protein of unknown function (DUF3592)